MCYRMLIGVGLLSCVVLCGCGAPMITAEDVVVAPGQAARFSMSLDRMYGKASVAGADVDFLVNGQRVASAKTDINGDATASANIPQGASNYTVRARAGNETAESRGRIFPWNGSRTAVAVDVDDTISATDYGSLFLTDKDTTSLPLENSPEAVRSMASNYDIVYVSARPRWLHEKTKDWLDAHGFPPGPVLHASKFEACFRQEYYKQQLIKDFQRQYPNLLIGVGDKGVDERAYGQNRMLGVIVGKAPNVDGKSCVVKPDWQQVRGFFDEHRDSLSDAQRLQQMLHSSNGELFSQFGKSSPYGSSGTMADAQPPTVSTPARTQRSLGPNEKRGDAGSGRSVERGDWIYGYQE